VGGHGHDKARYGGVTDDVFADTADDSTLHRPHASSSHHNQLGLLILGDAADSLARVLVRFATQLEMQLQNSTHTEIGYHTSMHTSEIKYLFTFKGLKGTAFNG